MRGRRITGGLKRSGKCVLYPNTSLLRSWRFRRRAPAVIVYRAPAAGRAGYIARRAPAAGECGYVGAACIPLAAHPWRRLYARVCRNAWFNFRFAGAVRVPTFPSKISSTNAAPIRTNRPILLFGIGHFVVRNRNFGVTWRYFFRLVAVPWLLSLLSELTHALTGARAEARGCILIHAGASHSRPSSPAKYPPNSRGSISLSCLSSLAKSCLPPRRVPQVQRPPTMTHTHSSFRFLGALVLAAGAYTRSHFSST